MHTEQQAAMLRDAPVILGSSQKGRRAGGRDDRLAARFSVTPSSDQMLMPANAAWAQRSSTVAKTGK